MRQALELALEVIQDYVEEYGPHDKDSGAQYAINAIKEALAQPEQWGASAVTHPEYIAEQKAKTQELRSMLAQPEQEPVAFDVWLQECESMIMAVRHGVKFLLMPEESAVRIGTAIQNTTPPQRKPLTDEQIAEMWLEILGSTPPSGIHEDGLQPWRFARAIEAAHGIKE